MSAELLSAAAGAALSLAFSYIPGLSSWFESLDGTHKRLVMLGALLAAALAAFGFGCLGIEGQGDWNLPACSQGGALRMAESFVLALIANQATFLISPRSNGTTRGNGAKAQ